MMRYLALLAAVIALASGAFADAPKTDTPADKPATVTFYAAEEKVSSLLDRICKQTGARILVETTAANVKIRASVKDIPVEDALTAICKNRDIEWRKILLKADSALLKKPESLASTVRLMAGMSFPDILIEKTSKPESLVHIANKPAVDAIPEEMRKDLGMVAVYLVTNDKADRVASDKANTNVEKYKKLSKESMELFMKMSPEEREEALAAGATQMEQMDPKYLAEMSQSVMKNPELMQRMMQGSSNMLMQMSTEDRRALIRSQMQMQQYMSPELLKLMQEDAIAVMKEMGKIPPDFQMPPPEQ